MASEARNVGEKRRILVNYGFELWVMWDDARGLMVSCRLFIR